MTLNPKVVVILSADEEWQTWLDLQPGNPHFDTHLAGV